MLNIIKTLSTTAIRRNSSTLSQSSFGIVLDIDGVVCRGRQLIPRVKEAFEMITDKYGNFRVPTVFLTNGTNCTQLEKAKQLSDRLGFWVPPECVILAHSPLRMFTEYHEKQVLVVSQKSGKAIAKSLGFKKVTTIDDLCAWFPHLDCTDFSRQPIDPDTFVPNSNFRPIEAIILLGEPLKWETSLQMLMDCILSNGRMDSIGPLHPPPDTNLPIIACNVDLIWMADIASRLPRIGHGVFVHTLESLYHKMRSRPLHYEAVLGKPTEVCYLHAAHKIQRHAKTMNLGDVKNLYVVGDNPMSDILGARLFDRYLSHGGRGRFDHLNLDNFEKNDGESPIVHSRNTIERCVSILVETGVYKADCTMNGVVAGVSALIDTLSPGEKMILNQPDYVELDLYDAIRTILRREGV